MRVSIKLSAKPRGGLVLQFLRTVVVVSFFAVSLSFADDTSVKRLQREAPYAWEQLEKNYNGKSFNVETVQGDQLRWSSCVRQLNGNIRIEYERNPEDSSASSRVELVNDRYEATLSSNPDSNGQWNLEKCKIGPWIGHGNLAVACPGLRVLIYHLPNVVVGLVSIPESRDSGIVLNNAWTENDPFGDELIVADFLPAARNVSGELVVNEEIAHGFILRVHFSPKRNWCVTKVHCKNRAIAQEISVELFFENENCHPSEIRMVEENLTNGKQNSTIETFTEPVADTLANKDFYLSAFGLTEPPIESPGNFRRNIMIGLMVGCLTGGLYWIKRLGNKREIGK